MTETINFKTRLDALLEISYNLQLAGVQLYHQKHMIIQSLTILDYNYKLRFFSGACNIVNLNINFFFNCMDYMYQSKTKIYTFINKLVSCQIFDTHEYTVSFISFAYETLIKLKCSVQYSFCTENFEGKHARSYICHDPY